VSDDPAVAFNSVLSEVIDVIQEVKQADWKIPKAHELHGKLDRLLSDLVRWKTLLADRDQALGVSPLSFMPSAEGRRPPNLWPGSPTDEEVLALVDEHLSRLEDHLSVAREEQPDEGTRRTLAEVARGLAAHRRDLTRNGSIEN
jgi:DNA-binding ferritin-like protein